MLPNKCPLRDIISHFVLDDEQSPRCLPCVQAHISHFDSLPSQKKPASKRRQVSIQKIVPR